MSGGSRATSSRDMDTLFPAGDVDTALPDDGEVARYCYPSWYNRKKSLVKLKAFMRRQNEPDLSTNWLQFFPVQGRKAAVDYIRRHVGIILNLESDGCFAVLNVGSVKQEALEKGFSLKIVHAPAFNPDQWNPSHSSISGVPIRDHQDAVTLATRLAELVTPTDIFDVFAIHVIPLTGKHVDADSLGSAGGLSGTAI